MFNQMKPGHILKFGVSPNTIASPGNNGECKVLKEWPTGLRSLHSVDCFSHPSGQIGDIAAKVATKFRSGFSPLRKLSYSSFGRSHTEADRPLGTATCDFVGYVDGQSRYSESDLTVFSKDFSGCLMAIFTVNGNRRVAHVAASSVLTNDCKQDFLDRLNPAKTQYIPTANLIGWFRPYIDAVHGDRKFKTINWAIKEKLMTQPDSLVTFGVVTNHNIAYSLDAFLYQNVGWVVTYVSPQRNLCASSTYDPTFR